MRLSLKGRRSDDLPADVVAALRDADGGKVLSAAPDADSRAWLVAGIYELALVDPGRRRRATGRGGAGLVPPLSRGRRGVVEPGGVDLDRHLGGSQPTGPVAPW